MEFMPQFIGGPGAGGISHSRDLCLQENGKQCKIPKISCMYMYGAAVA